MMAFSTILLDLDGTITDPYIGITNGVMYAYEKLGLEVPERESLRSFIGPPLMVEFTRRGFPEEQAREAVRLYREYYGRTGLFENRLIPGTVEFLKELKRMGKRVCLATSKPEEFSVRILEKFGVLEYFDFVGAATMDGSRGSKLEVIRYVLESTGAKPAECLMVGDRMHDIIGAHDAGMKCAAVLVGFGSREEFAQYKADYVCKTLEDVADVICRS
ncbi:MAG TPA: phosphoglycolate phosphatase [Ruminococcaceae bacterium]|jgi:phosphoglycolate phosphatase|nr:phosphoglycolate phosphatase [Oscillospiraceae bacterium]